MKNRILILLSIIALFSLLIACGGGSGSGGGGAVVSSSGGSSSPPLSGTASVTLSWDEPTENTDESPYTDPGGYIVYYGTSSDSNRDTVCDYSYSASIGNFTTTQISSLSSGAWYFAVTAVNSVGNKSACSEEIMINIS